MEWECRKVYDGDGGTGVGGGGTGEGSFGGGGTGGNGGVVRLRGLPYGCAEEEVRRFFTGWLSYERERRGCTVSVIVVVRLSLNVALYMYTCILYCTFLLLKYLHVYTMYVSSQDIGTMRCGMSQVHCTYNVIVHTCTCKLVVHTLVLCRIHQQILRS